MSKKSKEIQTSIASAIAEYQDQKNVAEYFKKKMGTEKRGDKIVAQAVFDKIVDKTLEEDSPEWTLVLMNIIGANEKNAANQTNVQVNIGDFLNNLKE